MTNIPNLITLSRVILAFVVLGLLLSFDLTPSLLQTALIGTVIVILGDYLDGLIARSLKQTSRFGGWFDIASDRLIELSYWIVFACLGWVSPWVSLIFLTRGILVDGVRSFASQQGFTAFGEKTMMQSSISRLVVSSPFSRAAYAALKAITFAAVILGRSQPSLLFMVDPLVYLTTFYCLIRGIPVLLEGWKFLDEVHGHQS